MKNFQSHFQILLLCTLLGVVYSHFHSIKDFESTLTKCCSIGIDTASAYQTNQTIKIDLSDDLCSINESDLSQIAKELQPQCSSIVKLCCNRELNKQTCRLAKKSVKQRLDHTTFSLTKSNFNYTDNQSNDKSDEQFYQQCSLNPRTLKVTRSYAKIVLLSVNQIYSECCAACKIGLFSALNDYKCIIQKNIKPSKLFEETFYDCCFNLKRKLDLASGKSVDLASIESLIYPELKLNISPSSSIKPVSKNSPDNLPNAIEESATSLSIIDKEMNYLKKHLDQQSKMLDNVQNRISSSYVAPVPIESKRINYLPINCPKGMRLDEKNSKNCVFIDYCKEKLNTCKSDEKCENTNPGFQCIKLATFEQQVSKPNQTRSNTTITFKSVDAKMKEASMANHADERVKEVNAQTTLLSDNENRPDIRYPFNTNQNRPSQQQMHAPITHSNSLFIRPRPQLNQSPSIQLNYPHAMMSSQMQPNPFTPYALPHQMNKIRTNEHLSRYNQRGFTKRKIDKCKIGNHNCNLSQTCRKTENDFVCVNNQDLEEYDRTHSFIDNQITTNLWSSASSDTSRTRRIEEILSEKSCPIGFEMNAETEECEDLNECELGMHNCSIGYRCDNKMGTFVCNREQSCGTGYTYNADTGRCEDINECKLGNHNCVEPYRCVNYVGTFRCEINKCKNGQKWIDNKCSEVTCVHPGYEYNSMIERCVDIDECVVGLNPVDLNSITSILNRQKVRYDASKLERLTNGRYAACRKEEECINSEGGFTCRDKAEQSNEQTSEINSLSEDSNFNQKSKFQCLSSERFDEEQKKCIPQIDKCKVISDLNAIKSMNLKSNERTKYCIHKCALINNQYTCECPVGYSSKEDGLRCVDIDECALDSNLCNSNSDRSFCLNTRGSYKCVDVSCPEGYVKNKNNNLQCVVIDKSSIYQENKSKYFSYSFISVPSNVSLTSENELKIASIRGAIVLDVNMTLLSSVSSKSDFNPNDLAKRDDFHLVRQENDHIYLRRSLVGPQEIKLKFAYTTTQNKRLITMNLLMLTIYVSEFNL